MYIVSKFHIVSDTPLMHNNNDNYIIIMTSAGTVPSPSYSYDYNYNYLYMQVSYFKVARVRLFIACLYMHVDAWALMVGYYV